MEIIAMLSRAFFLLSFVVGAVYAQATAPNLYRDQIQPILTSNCLGCHNSKVKQGGLDLSSRDALLKGSEHGPVVVLGNPGESQLYKLVAHISEPGMPFKGKKLPEPEIAQIAEWIKAGVPYGEPVADAEAVSAAEAAKHWAFRVPERPPVPKVSDARWSRNPIDAFITAEHAKRGLTPLPEADKRTLIRRVYLDLTGLPPTADEIRRFAADKDPRAYEKIVDQLLASPRYGERWGRHWLDVWRYSDWYGWRKEAESGPVLAAAYLAMAGLDHRIAE
jgi:mono/diheme cytochrome c family protein